MSCRRHDEQVAFYYARVRSLRQLCKDCLGLTALLGLGLHGTVVQKSYVELDGRLEHVSDRLNQEIRDDRAAVHVLRKSLGARLQAEDESMS